MRKLTAVVIFILTIITPRGTAGSSCSEQQMKDCEMKALKVLHSVNETDEGYNYFCDNLRTDSECPLDVNEECKRQHPSATTFYVGFFEKVAVWCDKNSTDRKIYFSVAFCSRMHPRGFQRCFKMQKEWFNNGTLDCNYWNFITCWSEQVSTYCGEDSEALSKYIDNSIPEMYYQFCNEGIIRRMIRLLRIMTKEVSSVTIRKEVSPKRT